MADLVVTQAHRALAAAQPLTHEAFTDHFRKVQGRARAVEIGALEPRPATEAEAQALAFAWAEEAGLLAVLIDRILKRWYSRDFVAAARGAGVTIDESNLQSILDPQNPTLNSGLFATRFPACAAQVCRVLVSGQPKGTGFLVAPRIVATACHVLDALIEWDQAEGRWRAEPGSFREIRFEFGNAIVEVGGVEDLGRTQMVLADRDWLLDASPCHPQELMGQVPAAPDDWKDHYDFVLCRLASVVEVTFRGIEMEAVRRLGAEDTQLTILQHPRAKPLRHQRQKAEKVAGVAYRVPHWVNTDEGSSGAPCLTDDLRVIGMHQAGRRNGPSQAAVADGEPNRCVPISWMKGALDALPVQSAGLMPVSHLSDGTPVFGRSALIDWMAGTLEGSNVPAILEVHSDGLPGLGFTARLMAELLPAHRHRVVRLNMADFQALPPDRALARLRQEMGLPEETPGDGLAAPAAVLRFERVEALMLDIARARQGPAGRDTWLVIDSFDLERLGEQDGGTQDLFAALLQGASAEVGLRIVVLCRKAGVSVPDTLARVRQERLGRATLGELEILMRYANLVTPQIAPNQISVFAQGVQAHLASFGDDELYAQMEQFFWGRGQ